MLWLTSEEKIEDYQIIVTQTHHQIAFMAYDIEKIEPFDTRFATKYFLPECAERDCFGGKCVDHKNKNCLNCNEWRRHEEILIDGFYAERDWYVVFLQTGIRVPISKEFCSQLKEFWEEQKAENYVMKFNF
jgi:hypothetical protein